MMREVHQLYAERREELGKALKSKEAILKFCDELRNRYKTIFGDFPDKQGLNSNVLKTSQEKDV